MPFYMLRIRPTGCLSMLILKNLFDIQCSTWRNKNDVLLKVTTALNSLMEQRASKKWAIRYHTFLFHWIYKREEIEETDSFDIWRLGKSISQSHRFAFSFNVIPYITVTIILLNSQNNSYKKNSKFHFKIKLYLNLSRKQYYFPIKTERQPEERKVWSDAHNVAKWIQISNVNIKIIIEMKSRDRLISHPIPNITCRMSGSRY